MAPPFKVKALYEYASAHDDDLQFDVGQIITVTDEEDDDWYSGEYVDGSGITQQGIFPRNFVEKYEPVAPPRPTRTRPKADPTPATAPEPAPALIPVAPVPVAPTPEVEPEQPPEPEPEPAVDEPAPPPQPAPVMKSPVATAPPPSLPAPAESAPADQQAPPVPKPAEAPAPSPTVATKPAPSKPGGPPPVATKPTGNAFRDRIAAFNKAAAPPIAPFKPGGLSSGSSSFIKKPFVAPPPSRNAYVPPPRETPTARIYRREEDPEIKEREAENQENAERAGLVPAGSHDGDEEEDQPKPTSLKERIALLQKQQMEQAQRHAEAAARKEKPKRPPKKRTESHETSTEPEPVTPALERQDTEDTIGHTSTDEPHPQRMPPPRRKSSKGPVAEHIQDGNEADMSGAGDTTEGPDELTEREDGDEKQKWVPRPPSRQPTQGAPREVEEKDDGPNEEEEEEEDDDDDVVDPEVRRKEELLARMAKMSGGMNMAGMFGMPMPGMAAPKKKKAQPVTETHEEGPEETSPTTRAIPIPTMMALPGMSQPKPEVRSPPPPVPPTPVPAKEESDNEEISPSTSHAIAAPELPAREPTTPPPIPGGRPAPPPVLSDSRPPPLPPTSPPAPAPMNQPSEGSESDDEMSERNQQQPPVRIAGSTSRAPPPPPVSVPAPPVPTSPRSPDSKRLSYMGDDSSPGSASQTYKRASRPPPPIPGSAPLPHPGQTRPPPPPPPGTLSRSSTNDMGIASPKHPAPPTEEEEITEYEGDYDTDIASSVPHKDALKAHVRQHSSDETPIRSPASEAPPNLPPPPPLPTSATPRAAPPGAPPPVPSQPPVPTRASMDMPRAPPPPRPSADLPRAVPPPPPPPKETTSRYDEDDYDPYNYGSPVQGVPIPGMAQSPTLRSEELSYPPEPSLAAYSPPDRRGPPAAPSGRASHRQSLDIHRTAGAGKRSIDAPRPSISMETGFLANDLDLAQYTNWWIQPNKLPPALESKKDIYYEFEESSSNSNGQQIVTKDLYVLYNDYSQTVITVSYDTKNMLDVELDQRHEAPPRTLRQDELEQAWNSLGKSLADAVKERKDTVVGDGTPAGLVHELLKPLKSALLPVGTRSYGALVYQNIGNASTQLNDEIRPGDIITIRNAKFAGKHGPMHAKYSVEIGKGDQVHTGIVAEWDGTKKKVRAWEQGRESKKCKMESFKLDDLRSGEVKIWRVMSRAWVGWADRA